MISLKEFMEVVDYQITEGDNYTWSCFGDEAKPYNLSAWNGDHDGWSFNIVFDTGTQEVYMVESCDYKHNRAYRLINPVYEKDYRNYAKDELSEYANQAWDGVNYVDLESDDDWIQKSLAIKAGEDYDTRVSIPVELSDEEFAQVARMAHERDITFNKMVEEILWTFIEREKEKTTD